MAEDLPTLVDNFIIDIPKFESATKVLSEEWAAKIVRATDLIRSGSYLESGRTTTAVARDTETAYPVLLDSLFKATACAGYMVEALRLAYVGKDVTERGVKASTLADDIRDLTTAAQSPEQLNAYLTRISGNPDYRAKRPADVMIAEVMFQSQAQTSGVIGDARALQAQADTHLAAGEAIKAIQGYLGALAAGHTGEDAKALCMTGLGQAYELADDPNRGIDWYRKGLDSGYLEGAPYIEAAVRMAALMKARGQNYTSIYWLSKAADLGDENSRIKAGRQLVELERPLLAQEMLAPLVDVGHREAKELTEQAAQLPR